MVLAVWEGLAQPVVRGMVGEWGGDLLDLWVAGVRESWGVKRASGKGAVLGWR